MNTTEAQIERRRWYCQRILRANPKQPDWMRYAAMSYLKATKPGKMPQAKHTNKLRDAWTDYRRHYTPEEQPMELIE